MIFPFSHRFPRVFPCFTHFPMGFPWLFLGFPGEISIGVLSKFSPKRVPGQLRTWPPSGPKNRRFVREKHENLGILYGGEWWLVVFDSGLVVVNGV